MDLVRGQPLFQLAAEPLRMAFLRQHIRLIPRRENQVRAPIMSLPWCCMSDLRMTMFRVIPVNKMLLT